MAEKKFFCDIDLNGNNLLNPQIDADQGDTEIVNLRMDNLHPDAITQDLEASAGSDQFASASAIKFLWQQAQNSSNRVYKRNISGTDGTFFLPDYVDIASVFLLFAFAFDGREYQEVEVPLRYRYVWLDSVQEDRVEVHWSAQPAIQDAFVLVIEMAVTENLTT